MSHHFRRSVAAAIFGLAAATGTAQHPVLPAHLDDFAFIHALVIDDPGNPLFGFHHFYVNELGAQAPDDGGPYPPGSIFLGLVYELTDSGDLVNENQGAGVLMMTKDPYATETGLWRFAEFRADGSYVEQDVRNACFTCHIQAASSDFVFSKPLDLPVFKAPQ